MLEILMLNLVGKELDFRELDNELTKIGIPSELYYISDWGEIMEYSMIMYLANESSENHYCIYFDVISMNADDEPTDCTLIKVTGIELN